MCQSAIIWAGIPRVVFGTSIKHLKKYGWKQIDLPAAEVNKKSSFYKGTLTGGVFSEKTDLLFAAPKRSSK